MDEAYFAFAKFKRGKNMSIAIHIIDHARALHLGCNHNLLSETKDATHHFNFSVDRAQLIALGYSTQETIDAKMMEVFKDLTKARYTQIVSNGYTKAGTPRTKERTLDLSTSIIAYHDSDYTQKNGANADTLQSGKTYAFDTSNNTKNTEPHFHIRLPDDDKNRGKDYVTLRNAVADVMKKHGLTANFMEETQTAKTRQGENKLSRFSWALQKATNKDIRLYVKDADKLRQNLDLLYRDAQNGNLQFYIKTMNQLQKRLDGINADFEHNDLNIRREYALPLSQKDLETIQILETGNKKAVEKVLAERGNKIARAYLEHCAGFENVIVDELKNRGYEIKAMDLSRLDLSKAQKAELKAYFAADRSTVQAQKELRGASKGKAAILEKAKADLEDVLQTAKNEKELKEFFADKGYADVSFSTKSKLRLGLKFTDKDGKKHVLSFKDTDYEGFITIRKQLESNSKTVSILTKGQEATGNDEIKVAKKAVFQAKAEYEKAKDAFVAEALKLREGIGTSQNAALALLNEKPTKDVQAYFLTGEGGSGKSYTTRKFIEGEEAVGHTVIKCGTTGIAASNIGGQTVHSLFGIGIAKNEKELAEFEAKNPKIKEQALDAISKADVIVIDEISMLHKDQMELVKLRLEQANFKGKVVYVGDFLQLPPVDTEGNETRFAFESKAWKEQAPKMVSLAGNKRSSNAEFTSILNRIRYGERSDEITDYLSKFANHKVDEKEATYIFATNREVKKHNAAKLEELEGTKHTIKTNFNAKDGQSLTSAEREKVINEVPIDANFEAKEGAKVLLLSNDKKQGIYNGDRAVVESINDEGITVKLERTGENVVIKPRSYEADFVNEEGIQRQVTVTGIPMRLSYAITAHKSQGLSLDHAVANAANVFEDSQFYIALSRAKNPDTLRVVGNKDELCKAIMSSEKALGFMHMLDKTTLDSAKQKLQIAKEQTEQALKNQPKGVSLEKPNADTRGHIQQAGAEHGDTVKNGRAIRQPSQSAFGNHRDIGLANIEAIITRLSDVQYCKNGGFGKSFEDYARAVARAAANRERDAAIRSTNATTTRTAETSIKEIDIDKAEKEFKWDENQKLQTKQEYQAKLGV